MKKTYEIKISDDNGFSTIIELEASFYLWNPSDETESVSFYINNKDEDLITGISKDEYDEDGDREVASFKKDNVTYIIEKRFHKVYETTNIPDPTNGWNIHSHQ